MSTEQMREALNPTQEQLDAFILRAGFRFGWENLESAARRMAERAVFEIESAIAALTAPAAEVPEAMGDEPELPTAKYWAYGLPLGFAADQLRTYAKQYAQWQSTRLRGGVPEGWKLVPVEPTPEMRKAAADAWLDCGSKLILNKAAAAIKAAIQVSKEPS